MFIVEALRYADSVVLVTSIGLHFLEMNAHSDLKSMVMVNTPGVNNARLRVAPVVRALVPQYEDKGIKLGSVFPWFGGKLIYTP